MTRKFYQTVFNRNYVGAMVANEGDNERGAPFEIGKRNHFSVSVWQSEIRGRSAQRQHGGWS